MASYEVNRRDLATNWRNNQRNVILQRQGVLNPNWWYTGYRPNVLDPLGASMTGQRGMAGTHMQYGVTPSDTAIDAEIGPNPYDVPAGGYDGAGGMATLNRADLTQRRGAAGANGATGTLGSPGGTLDFLQQAMKLSGVDEANKANDARYDEAKKLIADLGQRNQDRVANWGTAASADLEQRAKAALGSQNASLAARGLLNSTLAPSYAQRNASDLAREQQRISEMRDSRASEYDTRDTNALERITEARHDTSPAIETLIQLAMQYAAQGDQKGQQEAIDEIKRLRAELANQNGNLQQYQQAPQGIPLWKAAMMQNAIGNLGFPAFGLPQRGQSPQSPVNNNPSAGWDAALQERINAEDAQQEWERRRNNGWRRQDDADAAQQSRIDKRQAQPNVHNGDAWVDNNGRIHAGGISWTIDDWIAAQNNRQQHGLQPIPVFDFSGGVRRPISF